MGELFLTTIFDYVTVLGFYHMQSAPDRDDYVTINYGNIKANFTNNFRKYNSSAIEHLNITYDFGSIMHYGSTAFAINKNIKTIVPKLRGVSIGQRDGLSLTDVRKLEIMFKCEIPTVNSSGAYKCIQTLLIFVLLIPSLYV